MVPSPESAPIPALQPDVVIVGAGLAGIATASILRETIPDCTVAVIEKSSPQSNTQIAGQRFRAGIAGRREDGRREIAELLVQRNGGVLTDEMLRFAEMAVAELGRWTTRAVSEQRDAPEWFGPQWGTANAAGKGRGRSVLTESRRFAEQQGVRFVAGNATALSIEDGQAAGVWVETSGEPRFISARHIVLAGGTACGRLFESTNKDIEGSAHELAFLAGFPLQDTTLHMIHPFGNCGPDGKPRIGCFETDDLAGTKVYLNPLSGSPILDEETTGLLAGHQAHYSFPSIASRFRRHGNVVLLAGSDGKRQYARVSEHYWHGGIVTTDGVSVVDTANVYAVGDASNMGYWTNHRERYPGFALTKCLIDAELVTRNITARDSAITTSRGDSPDHPPRVPTISKPDAAELRSVNTRYLTAWQESSDASERAGIADGWLGAIAVRDDTTTPIVGLSALTALAHREVAAGRAAEPYVVHAADTASLVVGRNIA